MVRIVEEINIKNSIKVENSKFKPGDFLTSSNKPTSFFIFEGVDLSLSTYKKLSVLAYYDPSKYTDTSSGYQMLPFLEVSSKTKKCEKTVDTDEPCYWTRRCTDAEKEEAINKLREYGYDWDEVNLCLRDVETGKVISKIFFPKIEYKGEIIKPISNAFKKLLRKFCLDKNKKSSYDYACYHYGRYWGDEYDEYWD